MIAFPQMRGKSGSFKQPWCQGRLPKRGDIWKGAFRMDSKKEQRGLSRLGEVIRKERRCTISAEHRGTQNISQSNNTNSDTNMLLMSY